ncbi:VPA1262 family protein [Yersinia enterocolitica]|uniref:VPA1262 family protein n=1 Tax=Yersinia enterocolitica TaxID=630 RepID=UPI0030D037BF
MISFDSYINDLRLSRLLKNKSGKAVLCLWILEDKSENVKYHLLYGRLLPTSFANNKWSGSDGQKFKDFNGSSIRVLPVTITVSTRIVVDLIHMLLGGDKFSDISDLLRLGYVNKRFKDIIQDVKLTINPVFSPISFLLPRNAIDSSTKRSLNSDSSCYSGFIFNENKMNDIFNYTQKKDEVFFYIINSINSECGMEFDKSDSFRLGALELSVIPNFDDYERDNISFISCKKNYNFNLVIKKELKIRTSKILCSLNIYCGGRVIYSNARINKFSRSYDLIVTFDIDKDISESASCYIVELSFYNHKSKNYVPFFYHEYRYIKSIRMSIESIGLSKVIGQSWFNKLSSDDEGIKRARQLGTISQRGIKNNSLQLETTRTSFVDIENVSYPYTPKEVNIKTGDNFFEHYQEGNDHARLDFSDWYVQTFHDDNHKKVIIFDPYYEDAGLYLLIPKAKKGTEYVVFTTISDSSTPRIQNNYAGVNIGTCSKEPNKRIENLLDTLINLNEYLKGIKLTIYALPPISSGKPAFHDRYHLIQQKNGFEKGFHLSNSIQKANESYPLLITSISDDSLRKVISYVDGIFEKIKIMDNVELNDYKIYDSTENNIKPFVNDEFNYLHGDYSDEILASWAGLNDLRGLFGVNLVNKLKETKLILNENLQLACLQNYSGLKCFFESNSSEEIFSECWGSFCSILANNNFNDDIQPLVEMKSEKIKGILLKVVNCENQDLLYNKDSHYNFITKGIEHFAKHSITFDSFSHDFDYKLSWSFRYALDYLLVNYPQDLINLFEINYEKINNKKITNYEWFFMRKLIFKFSFHLEFVFDETLISSLIKSKVEILKWLGLLAISKKLERMHDMNIFLDNLDCAKDLKFKYYTWLLSCSAINKEEGGYKQSNLYAAYFLWILDNYQSNSFKSLFVSLVNIFTGNLSKISWLEPTFSKEIVQPLIEGGIITYSDVSETWFLEFHNLISGMLSHNSYNVNIFSKQREGVLLDYCIFYISKLETGEIRQYISKIKVLANKSSRIIRKSLSRSIDWTSWDQATKAALIILKFCEGIEKGGQSGISELNDVIKLSGELVKFRNSEEWLSMQTAGNEYAYLFQ